MLLRAATPTLGVELRRVEPRFGFGLRRHSYLLDSSKIPFPSLPWAETAREEKARLPPRGCLGPRILVGSLSALEVAGCSPAEPALSARRPPTITSRASDLDIEVRPWQNLLLVGPQANALHMNFDLPSGQSSPGGCGAQKNAVRILFALAKLLQPCLMSEIEIFLEIGR